MAHLKAFIYFKCLMPQSLSKLLISKLIDWLIAAIGAGLLLWFLLTQPVWDENLNSNYELINSQNLQNHVEQLTRGYAPRTLNYKNLNDAGDYIFRQLQSFGLPSYQTIDTISNQYRNITLQLGPDTEELFVIGAHYDAEDDSIDTEGNASGVAILIELARQLAENNENLEIGVVLVAYPISLNQTNDLTNTGSYIHATSLNKANKKVRLMISLDTIGHESTENYRSRLNEKLNEILNVDTEESVNLFGRFRDFISIRELKKSFVNESSLDLATYNLFENITPSLSSDHVNYWKQGFPAVLISDAITPRILSRNKPNKFSIENLNYEKMAKLVGGLYQVVVQSKASAKDKLQLATRRSRNKTEHSTL